VSDAPWVCDSCETNNFAQDSVCRMCQRVPGSVTGEVQIVQHPQQWSQLQEQPKFIESKHAVTERPVFSLMPTPAPVRPAKPPPPAPRPPAPVLPVARPPVVRRRKSKKALWVVGAVIVGLGIIGNLTDTGGGGSDSGSGSSTLSQTACPAAAATWLPAGGSGSALVVQYETEKHVVTLCRDKSGMLWYDGLVKGAEVTPSNHISLLASPTPSGFIAHNKGYTYDISGSELTLTNNGKLVARYQLTQVAP
jgi:hypothetical protein